MLEISVPSNLRGRATYVSNFPTLAGVGSFCGQKAKIILFKACTKSDSSCKVKKTPWLID